MPVDESKAAEAYMALRLDVEQVQPILSNHSDPAIRGIGDHLAAMLQALAESDGFDRPARSS